MAAVQMNTRISSNLKKSGDDVFSKIGMNPSQIVRLVGEFASRNKHRPEYVSKTLKNLSTYNEGTQDKKKSLNEAKNIIAKLDSQDVNKNNNKNSLLNNLEGSNLRDYIYDEKFKETDG